MGTLRNNILEALIMSGEGSAYGLWQEKRVVVRGEANGSF